MVDGVSLAALINNKSFWYTRLYPHYRSTAPYPGFGAVRKMHRSRVTPYQFGSGTFF